MNDIKRKLEPYEMICPKCSGSGYTEENSGGHIFTIQCPKCRGYKIIDWIENIIGVKDKKYPWFGDIHYNSLDQKMYIFTKKGWRNI